jgi:hypothetical protein
MKQKKCKESIDETETCHMLLGEPQVDFMDIEKVY